MKKKLIIIAIIIIVLIAIMVALKKKEASNVPTTPELKVVSARPNLRKKIKPQVKVVTASAEKLTLKN